MRKNPSAPPALAEKIVRRMNDRGEGYAFLGDMNEEYLSLARKRGEKKARAWYWGQVLRGFPVFLKDSVCWSSQMLKNYLLVTWRNVKRQKGYSFLNIFGLALGMACAILIVFYIHHELSYDRFHANADRIYRVTMEGRFGGEPIHMAVTPNPLAPALVSRYPEVAAATRVLRRGPISVKYADREFMESGIVFADPSLFEVLTFPLVRGDAKTALARVGDVVLTERTAAKYFGTEDPVGKVITFDNRFEYAVTGVIQDIPPESHLRFDLACSMETYHAISPGRRDDWINTVNGYTYVRLNRTEARKPLEAKLLGLAEEKMGKDLRDMNGEARFLLQPLANIHLRSNLQWEFGGNGDILYVYIFAAIAVGILAIACVNFTNLATARSARRAREVGMRKVVGACRRDLIGQFLAESMGASLLALMAALVIVKVALPIFESISGFELTLGAGQLAWLVPLVLGLVLFVGFAAGSYPAVYLSALRPGRVLKGGWVAGSGSARFRRLLVVGQFVLSSVMIIGTLIIGSQIRYMKSRDLGFRKDQILAIRTQDRNILNSLDEVKARLKEIPGVLEVAATTSVPGQGQATNAVVPEGAEGNASVLYRAIDADADFIRTMGMEIVQGRDFSQTMPTDGRKAVLINETAVRRLGWKSPIGRTLKFSVAGSPQLSVKTVVGVVRDFNYSSLREAVEPLYINNEMVFLELLAVKIKADEAGRIVSELKQAWKTISPGKLFDYFFASDLFAAQFRSEERLNKIFSSFSLLAIAIACLGLFGLASFLAEKMKKEIGIRRVLGASLGQVVWLLSREFLVLVGLAALVAWPIAYSAMSFWLRGFAYRTTIQPWAFIGSALAALAIAFLTVSYQAARAASANPVESLKYE
jgi:putative ABC transport system permease protein